MRLVHKAVAAVIRWNERQRELLVFDHPLAGTQIPKGTVEPGEALDAAAARELREESGLDLWPNRSPIGEWEWIPGRGSDQAGEPERHRWHVFAFDASPDVRSSWDHVAEGSPAEEGQVFGYRWVPIDASMLDELHPLFGPVARLIYRTTNRRGAMGRINSRSVDLHEEVRHCLLHDWDPIDVRDTPEAHDEYDSYVAGVCALIGDGADTSRLRKHLVHTETVNMGRSTPSLFLDEVVRKLLALRDEHQ